MTTKKYVRIIDTPGIITEIHPHMSSYESSKELILNSFYGEGSSLQYGLEKYLDYETETIIYSLLDKFSDHKQLVSKEYLQSFDIIFVNSFNFLLSNKDLLIYLKKRSLVVVWDGVFKNLSKIKHCYHAILTCSEDIQNQYQKLNTPCFYLPFSYDNRLDEILKVEQSEAKHNFCAFIGGINIGKQSHFERINSISAIRNDVDLYLKIGKKSLYKNLFLFLKNFSLGLKYYQIRKRNISTVYGLEYYKKILDYRGVINNHLDNITTPSNIRLFEVTGLGRVLITDRLAGLNKLFTEDEEILAYSTMKELKEKIRIVSNDKEYSQYLSSNARARTLRDYSIQNRCLKFDNIIKKIG